MKPKVIVVNAPKGGVGKTTTAVNLSIFLYNKGLNIVGYDVAQGELFSKQIAEYNKITIKMFTEELSQKVSNDLSEYCRKNKVDFIIVDTDDYYDVFFDFIDDFNKVTDDNVNIIVPFPNGYQERERIPDDLRKVVLGLKMSGKERNIFIFCNKMSKSAKTRNKKVLNSLENVGIGNLLIDSVISMGENEVEPYYIEGRLFSEQLSKLVEEINILWEW